jgi:two-component system, LytTR family, response regulator AlgR
MKVLIVDDESLARLRLRGLLSSLSELTSEVRITEIAEAADAPEALALLRVSPFELLLLDIRMPGPDGLRLAAKIKQLPQPPAVIFVTAHAEHALKAFELEAVDYLTKPVRRERLLAALQRVQQRLNVARAATATTTAPAPAPAPAPLSAEAPALVVSDRGRTLRLPLTEVLYCKADQKYVSLRTTEQSYLLDESLTELEQRLAALGGSFIRVHRNALVSRQCIRALELRIKARDADPDADTEGWAVRVAPLDEWLDVSRRQVAAVRAALVEGSK